MNKNKKQIQPSEIPLDSYESELKAFIDKGKFVSTPRKEFKKTKVMLQEVAKNYLDLKRSKKITLRVKNEDLLTIKVKAKKAGIPYQRIIGLLLKGYADEKIRLTL